MRRKLSLALPLLLFVSLASLSPPANGEDWRAPPLIITSTGVGIPRALHPGAISQISAEEIDALDADHPAQILNLLPGLFVNRGSGQEHLTAIRSPVLTAGAGAGSFLFLEEGIPLRAAGFANVNALMEAMPEMSGGAEVARGPASALYGSNALHGLVNILSRAPAPDGDFLLDSRTGPHDLIHFALSASRSLGERRGGDAFRLSLAYGHDGGYRESSGFDHWKARLRHDSRWGRAKLRILISAVRLNQQTAAYIVGEGAYKDRARRRSNPSPDAYRQARAFRAQARLRAPFSEGGLWDITPYLRQTSMRFLMHFLPGTPTERNGHFSLGLRTRLRQQIRGGHEIALGSETEWTRGGLSEIQSAPAPFPSLPPGVHYDYQVRSLTQGLFLQSAWRLSPEWRLNAGLRLDYLLYLYDNRIAAGDLGRFRRPADRRDDFLTVSPKLSLLRLFGAQTVFLRYARGQRAPQTTDLYRLQTQQEPGALKSETLDSLEAGWRIHQARWRMEAVLFYMRKRHFHFRDADGFTVADGKTSHWGLEWEARARLARRLSLRLAGTYARHRYRFDRTVRRESEIIRDGNEMDSAPRLLANAELLYDAPRFRAALEWAHVGSYYTDAANAHSYPGHDLLHLRLAYKSRRWRIFLNILNLADTRYATRADYAFGNARYFPGEGRSFHGGVKLRF